MAGCFGPAYGDRSAVRAHLSGQSQGIRELIVSTETITSANRGFQYKHGDRPLDGYVIQRGAGRGGFGEVYYAISDSGREVALKVVQTYEQIELRGISHCMNLKSPHLISIFDIKYGQDGRPWVIMEFVAGPSLRELLDASPSGLGVQKAAFFLREIGKGLTYLHECGIVHRDLKPANIFYENGYVKIGDYGLSKAISTSQHSGQTVTVGTVHYMAPEVGEGRYDQSIDIYALGALLHEMLTGQVPFFGSSAAEVLMKHLTNPVDVTNVPEPFASVIRKAMAKNPADRYQSVQEMVEAVFGSEHVRNSVSSFSPDDLTMVAGQVARKLPGNSSFAASSTPGVGSPAWNFQNRFNGQVNNRFERRLNRGIERLNRARERLERKFGPLSAQSPAADLQPVNDPIPVAQRRALMVIALAITAFGTGLAAEEHGNVILPALFTFTAALGATIGVLVGHWRLWPTVREDQTILRHLAVGGPATVLAALLSLPFWVFAARGEGLGNVGELWIAIIVSLFFLNWGKRMNPQRSPRVQLGHLIVAAVPGLILGCNLPAMGVAVGATLALEVLMPWAPGARPKPEATLLKTPKSGPPPFPVQPQSDAPVQVQGDVPVSAQSEGATPMPQLNLAQPVPPPIINASAQLHNVGRGARIVWLVLFCGLMILGLNLLLVAMVTNDSYDRPLMVGFGISSLIASIYCFRRSRRRAFRGWGDYLIRPVIQIGCFTSIVLSFCALDMPGSNNNDLPPIIFFIVAPLVILFTMLFFKRGDFMAAASIPAPLQGAATNDPSDFSFGNLVSAVGRLALNLIASVLLLIAMLIAIAVVADLPGFFNSPLVDPHISHDLQQQFGHADWPQMARAVGAIGSFVFAVIGTIFLLLARRRLGGLHTMRGLAGVAALFLAIQLAGHALPDWSNIHWADNGWEIVSQWVHAVNQHRLAPAAIPAGLALLLFVWPAHSSKRNRFSVTQEVLS